MSNDQMREAFEAWMTNDGEWPQAVERSASGYRLAATETAWRVWQAAYAVGMEWARDAATDDVCKAFNDGFAAGEAAGFRKGMERAARICEERIGQGGMEYDQAALDSEDQACADAIRAEIKGVDHEG